MKRFATALAPAIVVAGLSPLLLLTAPAEAATTFHGCTVHPVRPAATGQVNPSGIPKVKYDILVTCNAGRTVQVEQFRLEEDIPARDIDGIDDVTGLRLRTVDFTAGGAPKSIGVTVALPKTPGDGAVEEVYQKVRFRVTTSSGTSAWTPFEDSAVRAIHR